MLFHNQQGLDYDQVVSSETKQERRIALMSSAILNIKKSNGKPTSRIKDICGYVKEDKELLREQISMIKPDLVICGGVWKAIEEIWRIGEIFTGIKISRRLWRIDNMLIVNYFHPSCRLHDDLLFLGMSSLADSVRMFDKNVT
jgi:hypothetical protein